MSADAAFCRGSYILGSACGDCSRCAVERSKWGVELWKADKDTMRRVLMVLGGASAPDALTWRTDRPESPQRVLVTVEDAGFERHERQVLAAWFAMDKSKTMIRGTMTVSFDGGRFVARHTERASEVKIETAQRRVVAWAPWPEPYGGGS